MAAPRLFSASFAAQSVIVPEIWSLTPGTDRPIELVGLAYYSLSSGVWGEAGEGVRQIVVSVGGTAGSGGTSVTPVDWRGGDSTSDATVAHRQNAHSGGSDVYWAGYNTRFGLNLWLPIDEYIFSTEPIFIGTGGVGGVLMYSTVVWREL